MATAITHCSYPGQLKARSYLVEIRSRVRNLVVVYENSVSPLVRIRFPCLTMHQEFISMNIDS